MQNDNVKEFLKKDNLSIMDFEKLSKEELDFCLVYDQLQKFNIHKLIPRLLFKKIYKTEFIIYLINLGFEAGDCETSAIIESNNIELLQYYHKHNLIDRVCTNGLDLAMLYNHMDMFMYILDHNLYNKNNSIEMAMKTSLEQSKYQYFEILKKRFSFKFLKLLESFE